MVGYVRAAQRREQLLGAAREVMLREGMAGLTLRAVAQQAGVHLSTLQYIFPSRAELVRALSNHILAHRDGFSTGDAGLEAELKRTVDWYSTQFLADPAILELIRFEILATAGRTHQVEHPELAELPSNLTSLIPARIEEICARSNEEYDLEVAGLVRLWSPALLGLIYQLLRDGDLEAFCSDANSVVAALVRVAAPRPRA